MSTPTTLRTTGSAAPSCPYPDRRGATWAYAAAGTGTAANALLLGFFALMPVASRGNPLGPANDLVGALSTATMIPAAIAIGRCLPRRRLQRAALAAMATATATGPLLVFGVLPFPVATGISMSAFGVIVTWIAASSRRLHHAGTLPTRTARLGQAIAGTVLAAAGVAGLAALLPAGSAAQPALFGTAALTGFAAFCAVPVWFALMGRWLDPTADRREPAQRSRWQRAMRRRVPSGNRR